jgi:hypothetical protein
MKLNVAWSAEMPAEFGRVSTDQPESRHDIVLSLDGTKTLNLNTP